MRRFLKWLPEGCLWGIVALFLAAVVFPCVWFGLYSLGWRGR